MAIDQVFLSRRNLLTLLSKLDRKKDGGDTQCTIIKRDADHKKYPQTMEAIIITALEDEEYYNDRVAGAIHPADEAIVNKEDTLSPFDVLRKQFGNNMKLIQHGYGRKCSSWKECHEEGIYKLPHSIYDLLDVVDLSGTIPFDDLPNNVTGGIFIAIVDGEQYLVNTEGYHYNRYIVRVRPE